ncbi:urease accessory protein UreD [Gordonia alkaliphila]|uniref:Urease accessory protein UreD n=1 Tax=Gordonia alkaliphila TaxID=1053547 RepID=A0ABP8ZDA6_9ACTN
MSSTPEQPTVVEVECAPDRARVTMSAGAGAVLVPRLLGRTATSASIALVAGGALLLPGDRLDVRIAIGAACTVEIVEVGGTVAYGDPDTESMRRVPPSFWDVDVTLAAGARLAWMGREVVVAEGADLTRRLRLTAAAGATALLRETTVLGRSGERGGRARVTSTVDYADEPLLAEDTDFAGRRPVPGILGDARVLDSLLLVGRRPDPPVEDPALPGYLALEGPGALARHLGDHLHTSELGRLWTQWRTELLSPNGTAT